VWEGYTKAPHSLGLTVRGKDIQYIHYFTTKQAQILKKFLSMLGTAAEGEENQVGDGPQLQ
jgi:hypothetical protein